MSKIKHWLEMQEELKQEQMFDEVDGWERLSFEEKYTGDKLPKQVGGNHYATMAITPTEYILANKIGWLEGNAIKYISRHQNKNGVEDIDKAIHYLELVKEKIYGK